jgi:hypothetical protein
MPGDLEPLLARVLPATPGAGPVLLAADLSAGFERSSRDL